MCENVLFSPAPGGGCGLAVRPRRRSFTRQGQLVWSPEGLAGSFGPTKPNFDPFTYSPRPASGLGPVGFELRCDCSYRAAEPQNSQRVCGIQSQKPFEGIKQCHGAWTPPAFGPLQVASRKLLEGCASSAQTGDCPIVVGGFWSQAIESIPAVCSKSRYTNSEVLDRAGVLSILGSSRGLCTEGSEASSGTMD